MNLKNIKTVAVSGGFDPIHIGHIRLFKNAKKLGDKLIVILNNDNWLIAKKGYVFMPQKERKEIIEALECVDEVIISTHTHNPKDMSVCKELKEIQPDIFANGGDRKENNVPEVGTCKELDIEMAWNVGGEKLKSSSELVKDYRKESAVIPKFFTKKPWGGMWKLIKTKKFWLKFIFVQGRTSLQSHQERTEYQCGVWKVKPSEKHIMQNGVFFELAIGNPKEEDIIRYKDDYGRD